MKSKSNKILVTSPLMPNIDRYKEMLDEIWASRWLSNGGCMTKELERRLCSYLAVENISLFNNGTIALMTAIQSLRLQGEVITTPFSFPATTHVLNWNGITPVFCDVCPHTLTIDPNKIEALITSKTSAILGVHVYGIPCYVEEIQRIADVHGLRVIYDAAHAFGCEIDGKPISDFGDISMFSFHPTKLFHTAEGGALVFGDVNLKERIELLKNFGIKNQEEVILPGINGKMNELSAAMGLSVLPLVNNERERRSEIRALYTANLGGIPGLQVLTVADNVKSSQQYFAIRITAEAIVNRDDLYDDLKENNVFPRKYFSPLISNYPCYSMLPTARAEALPVATLVEKQVLCLPFYGELSNSEVLKICKIVRKSLGVE
ncbi:DegT/DnrJ/EryC1/StrS family aminotransferase [Simiduia aestuariiviva]|uniref:dTDP-4-amino-4,6-dideoxygalactose transaminase n=1 Tax=Simiduia aestuariiviva TaxID=1510459 RepID=A0A839US72_9GAMM|nr:DegT/DnrJ/EryC1/StrS family aminotransferase [Simiduia aestuariiviva]MBB3168368.1 dTDP-4-amino-4,6-dideoxygalactose transaminase [Simiduia aestuariiviva]